jgi:hypothetical protein
MVFAILGGCYGAEVWPSAPGFMFTCCKELNLGGTVDDDLLSKCFWLSEENRFCAQCS